MNELIQTDKLSFIVGAAVLSAPVTLVAGSNITLTPSGNTLTIAATGGGGSGATTALDNLVAVAVNTSLIPGIDNSIDLGTNDLRIQTAYVGTSLVLNHVGQSTGETLTFDAGLNFLTGILECTTGFLFTSDVSGSTGPFLQFDPAGGSGNGDILFGINGVNGAQAMTLDDNTTSGETPMLLLDVTAGTLQRVSIGAADSGGTGFRVLRIPN